MGPRGEKSGCEECGCVTSEGGVAIVFLQEKHTLSSDVHCLYLEILLSIRPRPKFWFDL